MVGLPGSGKTTFVKESFPDYVRISQDDLGSKERCTEELLKAIQQGKNVVIDRTNINRKQRSHWINLGLNMGVSIINCIYLDVHEEECVSRIHFRKNHPTITQDMSLEKKKQIVYSFNKDFEMPSLDEGFNSIYITRN